MGIMVDSTEIENWIPKFIPEYNGAYQFGSSAPQYNIIRIINTTKSTYAQIEYKYIDESINKFVSSFQNLTNVSIDKQGRLYSNELNGRFIIFTGFGQHLKCLELDRVIGGHVESDTIYEIGTQTKSLVNMLAGKYPFASYRELTTEELSKYSSDELQIMRNEIFARYGYRFRHDGKMEKYFNGISWYKPIHSNVSEFLTELEKDNIETITKLER